MLGMGQMRPVGRLNHAWVPAVEVLRKYDYVSGQSNQRELDYKRAHSDLLLDVMTTPCADRCLLVERQLHH